MNWHPEREKRIRRDSLDYEVPRDRQLHSLEINRPGDVVVITDTLYPVYCDMCDTMFTGPTNHVSTNAFMEHIDEEHPSMPYQYTMPDWFREMKDNGNADIMELQHDR